jgi:hypothetical protein
MVNTLLSLQEYMTNDRIAKMLKIKYFFILYLDLRREI